MLLISSKAFTCYYFKPSSELVTQYQCIAVIAVLCRIVVTIHKGKTSFWSNLAPFCIMLFMLVMLCNCLHLKLLLFRTIVPKTVTMKLDNTTVTLFSVNSHRCITGFTKWHNSCYISCTKCSVLMAESWFYLSVYGE